MKRLLLRATVASTTRSDLKPMNHPLHYGFFVDRSESIIAKTFAFIENCQRTASSTQLSLPMKARKSCKPPSMQKGFCVLGSKQKKKGGVVFLKISRLCQNSSRRCRRLSSRFFRHRLCRTRNPILGVLVLRRKPSKP